MKKFCAECTTDDGSVHVREEFGTLAEARAWCQRGLAEMRSSLTCDDEWSGADATSFRVVEIHAYSRLRREWHEYDDDPETRAEMAALAREEGRDYVIDQEERLYWEFELVEWS